MAIKPLREVPREKAFYFFTSIGNYTGESASSLREFGEKVKLVNVKSLEFHLGRNDFEKWATEVLEDKDLAAKIVRLQTIGLTGDLLRNRLHSMVLDHYNSLMYRYGKR
jgi:hypothetical protein